MLAWVAGDNGKRGEKRGNFAVRLRALSQLCRSFGASKTNFQLHEAGLLRTKKKTKQNGHVLRSYEHQVLSNLNGDLAGQIPVKKEKLFSSLPSTPIIISTNFYSSHKELGKALFMYQTRLNTSQYL